MIKLTEEERIELGITSVVMAIRENMMNYFKESCVREFCTADLYWDNIRSENRGNHQYERHEHQMHNPKRLYLSGTPLFGVQKAPMEVTFYDKILARSEPFTIIGGQISDFFGTYLPGVVVKHDDKYGDKSSVDGKNDNQLFIRASHQYNSGDPTEPQRLHSGNEWYIMDRDGNWCFDADYTRQMQAANSGAVFPEGILTNAISPELTELEYNRDRELALQEQRRMMEEMTQRLAVRPTIRRTQVMSIWEDEV